MITNSHISIMLMGLIVYLLFPINSFSQTNWEKYEDNPVLLGVQGEWIWKPVVIFEDDLFKMWYSTTDGVFSQVGYAESTDGLDWIKFPVPVMPSGYPGDWDNLKQTGSVIRINDTLKMWYNGSQPESSPAIGYAWSVVEYIWNYYPEPVLEKGDGGSWDNSGVNESSVSYDGTEYKMWYSGWGIDGHRKIGYATSTNGINWDKYENSPVLEPEPETFYNEAVYAGPVILKDGLYQMWFTGFDGDSYNPYFHDRIGYATSPDGINWTVENENEPVLDTSLPVCWDDHNVWYPSVLIHNGRYKMWYTGDKSISSWKFGFALGDTIIEVGLPDKYRLNHEVLTVSPSPFTYQTTLSYQLLVKSPVRIDVYNAKGHLISTLVNEMREPGKHEVIFKGEDLQPGIYFCVLKTDPACAGQTKKMIKL